MKAVLKEDMIISAGGFGVEIGAVPSGVGVERLRFDGSVLIDLMDLTSIWVRETAPGFYELHCVYVPHTQLVTMTYTDRGNLIMENGVIRVMTTQEVTDKKQAIQDDITDNRNLKDELRQLVDDLTYAKIDTHIDNVFGALTAAQKSSLKRLYKVVLFLAKRR